MNDYLNMKNTLIILFVFILCQCSSSPSDNSQNTGKLNPVPEQNPVEVLVLEKSNFSKELVSNGKLLARNKSVLRFRISEELEYLAFKNGDKVNKGQVIARLFSFNQEQALERAQYQLQKAEVEYQDVIALSGYNAGNRQAPENIVKSAKIRSGLLDAENNLESAKFNYESTILIAPFSGVIANLKHKVHDVVSPGEEFCTLINESVFEVEFSILETELKEVELGKEIKIIPFVNDQEVKGRVCEINPVVEENGMITVKAGVKNPGKLMEGMNVEVLLETRVPEQLVVPKSAVVLRQNQEVLFVYKSGKAFWTYVQTEFENSNSYTVQAHPDKGGTLAPGDTVIISGNLNLAHESEVVVK